MMAIGAGFLLGSCSKDFLDKQPTEYLSKDGIDKITGLSPHLMAATMNGLYAYNVRAFSGGTTGHDDFGQKGYDVYTDMLAGDMVLNSTIYGWYEGISDLSDLANITSSANYRPWVFYYYMIRGTNNVISGYLDENNQPIKSLTASEQVILGQAFALRAYMYYNLINLYTKGYDANEKILPIYTRPILTNTPAKQTQDVFALMESDLDASLNYFTAAGATGRGNNIDINVAKGFLAYVLAAKGTPDALAKVVTLTDEVKGQYSLASASVLKGGFNTIANNPNWMWGANLTTEDDLDLVSWWGQVDVFTYSYAAVGDTKGMSSTLYNLIDNADIRKTQFSPDGIITDVNGDTEDFGANSILPINKFYSATGKILMGQRIITSDYVFMRVEEMYLLNAEANARLGNTAMAQAALTDLLSIRLNDITYINGLSGATLIDEILLQTRIELWGEGKVLAALKRNKADIVYGANHLFFPNEVFSYDDSRLIFKVPQDELLNNPVYNN